MSGRVLALVLLSHLVVGVADRGGMISLSVVQPFSCKGQLR